MARKNRKQDEAGIALIYTIIAAMAILGAVTVTASQLSHQKRLTDFAVRQAQLEQACKAGIEMGIAAIWNDYQQGLGNTTGNLASYHAFINAIVGNNEDLNRNGSLDTSDGEGDFNGNGQFDIADPEMLIGASGPVVLANAQAQVNRVMLERTDDVTGSTLTITAFAQVGNDTMSAEQSVRVSGEPFAGFEFAVLAKNVICILCHADISSLAVENNADPDMYGEFDRIKVASTEELHVRPGGEDSTMSGTFYTRGEIRHELNGSTVSTSQIEGGNVRSHQFDSSNGKLMQNDSGALSQTPLDAAELDAEGLPEMFANFYVDYPTHKDEMTDGTVPVDFPAPFPDLDENRVVGDGEFDAVALSADGSISGGIAYGVADGDVYGGTSLPGSDDPATATAIASNSSYTGNLILVGTESDPIVIDGNFAVDGDVVIKGKVKGKGQLMVRGNAYVVGDTTYADAPGAFGAASDGAENAFALMTGGNIIMGDYLTINDKRHTQDTADWNSHSPRIDFRERHKTETVSKNGSTETVNTGYFDPGAVDPGSYEPSMFDDSGNEVPRQGQSVSFTTAEMMVFNTMEARKMQADPNYVPRFDGLRETQPTNVWIYDKSNKMHPNQYGNEETAWEWANRTGVDSSRIDNAPKLYMNPKNDWITESTLREIWFADEQSRPSSGRPMQFDGLLYTNNALFTLTRARMYGNTGVGHNSFTDGQLRIRGAIISPDLGVLAPSNNRNSADRGLDMLYDRRVRGFWTPEDTSTVAFRRLVYSGTSRAH